MLHLAEILYFHYGEDNNMDYISVKETAEKWGLSVRRVQILGEENRIVGVFRMGRMWLIPKDAEKPTDKRGVKNEENIDY